MVPDGLVVTKLGFKAAGTIHPAVVFYPMVQVVTMFSLLNDSFQLPFTPLDPRSYGTVPISLCK